MEIILISQSGWQRDYVYYSTDNKQNLPRLDFIPLRTSGFDILFTPVVIALHCNHLKHFHDKKISVLIIPNPQVLQPT